MLGEIEDKREQQRMNWLDRFIDSMDRDLTNSGRQWRTEEPGVLQSVGPQRLGHNVETEQQQQPLTGRSIKKGLCVKKRGIFKNLCFPSSIDGQCNYQITRTGGKKKTSFSRWPKNIDLYGFSKLFNLLMFKY